MSKSKKIFIGVSIAVGILLIAAVIVIVNIVIPRAEQTSHTVLAENYLLELDYNNAIAEYKLAIEIDPKNPDNYVGLAKAYSESGDDDAAEDILNDALFKDDEPDKTKIQEALDNLLNQEPETTEPTITTVATTSASITTTEITTTEQTINDYDVSQVVGMTAEEAKKTLENEGFTVLIQERFSESDTDLGSVIEASTTFGFGYQEIDLRKYNFARINVAISQALPERKIPKPDDSWEWSEDSNHLKLSYEEIHNRPLQEVKEKIMNQGVPVKFIEHFNGEVEKGNCIFWDSNGFDGYYYYVQVHVSAGELPETEYDVKIVPNVLGLNVDEAKQAHSELGLTLITSEKARSNVPKNVVLEQEYIPGFYAIYVPEAKSYSILNEVTYSLGDVDDDDFPGAYYDDYPDGIDGIKLNEIKNYFANKNFNYYIVKEEYNAIYPVGTVITTSYDTEFTIYVSAGIMPTEFNLLSNTKPLPNFSGMTVKQASEILKNDFDSKEIIIRCGNSDDWIYPEYESERQQYWLEHEDEIKQIEDENMRRESEGLPPLEPEAIDPDLKMFWNDFSRYCDTIFITYNDKNGIEDSNSFYGEYINTKAFDNFVVESQYCFEDGEFIGSYNAYINRCVLYISPPSNIE